METVFLAAATSAFAAPGVIDYSPIQASVGGFWVAILAGVLLAAGFHLVLTNLLVALGISMTGNLENKAHGSHNKEKHSLSSQFQKISTAAGIAACVTLSLALLGASYFAVKLSLVAGSGMAMTLGLVIWAAYFMLMLYVEARSLSSFAGSLMHYVRSGFHTAFATAGHVLTPSPQKQISRTIDKIREEVRNTLDDKSLKHKMEKFVKGLRPKELDYDKIKDDFKNMFTGFEIKERIESGQGGAEPERIFEIVKKHPRLKKEQAEKIAGIVQNIVKGPEKEGESESNGYSFEHAYHRTMNKIEDFLRHTGIEELQPERLKEDIDKIVNEPQTSKEVIINRLKQMNPEVLVHAVTDRVDIPEDQKSKIAESIKKTMSSITAAKESISSAKEGIAEKGTAIPKQVEDKVRAYLDSIEEPGLSFEELKEDFEEMIHDPKAAPEILKERFQHLDRNTLVALLSNNPYIPREHAEHFVSQIEHTKEQVLERAEHFEQQVKQRIEEVKAEALHQAEHVRKAAMAAAWWLLAAAVLSAGAAVLGGALAV